MDPEYDSPTQEVTVDAEIKEGSREIQEDQQREDEDLGYVRQHKEYARRHRFMSIERLNIFSDAVFATITTFMVVPLKERLNDFDVVEDLWSSLFADLFEFGMFVVSFWIVSAFWQDHVWILQNVEHVGDIGLILNVILLMITSLIPFLAAIMGNYYQYVLSAQLFGGCILLVTLVQGLMIVFAFRGRKMLSEDLSEGDIKIWLRRELLITTALKVLLSALSMGISMFSVTVALVLLFLTLFADWMCIIAVAIYRKLRDNSFNTTLRSYLSRRFILEDIDMDRTQTFTDGVFIIVATLIILDITTETFVPFGENMDEEAFLEELIKNVEPIFSYLSTFLTIGMIWYINYSMFYYLQRLSRLLLFLNRMSLLFVCVVPLGFTLVSICSVDEAGRNENSAVQFHCILIFFATIFQIFFWLAAHWKRDKHFSSKYHGVHKMRMFCMLMVYPGLSLLMFCSGFINKVFQANVIHLVETLVPVSFILLKLIFELIVHLRRSPGKPSAPTSFIELTESSSQNGKAVTPEREGYQLSSQVNNSLHTEEKVTSHDYQ